MGKDERIKKILASWRGPQRLKEDTWQNVQLVLDYYGFRYEKKADWVCFHDEFTKLARNPDAKEILQRAGLSVSVNFTIAVSHGAQRKSGVVIRCYLNHVLKAVELLEIVQRGKKS